MHVAAALLDVWVQVQGCSAVTGLGDSEHGGSSNFGPDAASDPAETPGLDLGGGDLDQDGGEAPDSFDETLPAHPMPEVNTDAGHAMKLMVPAC